MSTTGSAQQTASTLQNLEEVLNDLRNYIERERFKGYDPYDTLNAKIPLKRFGKWPPILATQIQKRNPINIRPLLGIKKELNPKALGLLLEAYCKLYEIQPEQAVEENCHALFEWLMENQSTGFSGHCWGYNFDWASPVKYLNSFDPNVVVTAFVARGVLKYCALFRKEFEEELLNSMSRFVLEDLPLHEDDTGICFSYTPFMKECCYNASLLGAEILMLAAEKTDRSDYHELAKKAVQFVVHRQQEDGRWNYSMNLDTGVERKQVDFHQGYVLDSLLLYHELFAGRKGALDCKEAITKGAHFYKEEQFFANGRSKWRLPSEWPVDIHHQAQGMISLTKLAQWNESYFPFAVQIAKWTIENMKDAKGYFYYKKYPTFTHKIPYMRWSQAWMFLALIGLLKEEAKGK